MKILLVAINAKYIHSNPAVHSLKACAGIINPGWISRNLPSTNSPRIFCRRSIKGGPM